MTSDQGDATVTAPPSPDTQQTPPRTPPTTWGVSFGSVGDHGSVKRAARQQHWAPYASCAITSAVRTE
jgi:hypothetical protein